SSLLDGVRIDGQVGKKPERTNHSTRLFAQHHLVSAAENLNFFVPKSELLREPNSLTIARFEHSGDRHRRSPPQRILQTCSRTLHALTRSAVATTSFARSCAMIELRCLMSNTSRSMVTEVKSGAERSIWMLSMLPSCSAMTCVTCASEPGSL